MRAYARPAFSLLPAMLQRTATRPAFVLEQRARQVHASAANDQGVDYSVKKSEDEWKKELAPETYYILREKGTERPGTGEYNKFYPKDGHFCCAGCGQPLYSAESKFDSGCGWPAFDKIVEGAVVTQTDRSMGMSRVEIMCGACGGHLGHVFEGEGFTPTLEYASCSCAHTAPPELALPLVHALAGATASTRSPSNTRRKRSLQMLARSRFCQSASPKPSRRAASSRSSLVATSKRSNTLVAHLP